MIYIYTIEIAAYIYNIYVLNRRHIYTYILYILDFVNSVFSNAIYLIYIIAS